MIETVLIVCEHEASQGAFVVINKEDFNPDIHTLYNGTEKQTVSENKNDPEPETDGDSSTKAGVFDKLKNAISGNTE